MSLMRQRLNALFNGVSQQPAVVRATDQANAVINAVCSVVDGVSKRPPTEHLAKLQNTPVTSAYFHTINRDSTERYVVVVTNGDLKVFDLNGVEKTVAFPDGKAYLTASAPVDDFSLVTVADYTFVVNKTVRVTMDAVGADQSPDNANRFYLGRTRFDWDSEEPTEFVAQRSQYAANPSGVTLLGAKQAFTDLPSSPAVGDCWEITGTADSNFLSYYVVRGAGVWEETVKPGLNNKLNATTMPWALARLGDGTFEFRPFSWAPRRVGDDVLNHNPSFVGRYIRGVFFYKNRLGLLTDENCVLSRAGDFGNFFRMTMLDLLDDDTIDVALTETNVALLNHATPFPGGLMLASDQTQFRVTSDGPTTPTSVSVQTSTRYPASKSVAPEAVGSDLYFVSEPGAFATIYEYFVDEDTLLTDAAEVTAHVPKYIPAGVIDVCGSSTHSALFVATSGDPAALYIYQFFWMGDRKVQSAWHKWTFETGSTVLHTAVIERYLYLLVSRSSGLYLERVNLRHTDPAPGLDYNILLDRRFQVTGVYNGGNDETTFTLPFAPVQGTFQLVRGAAFGATAGALVEPSTYTWVSSTQVKVPGNETAGACFGGASYGFRYEFSELFVRDENEVANTTGRLQLRTMTVNYVNTAYFATDIAPYGVDGQVEAVVPPKMDEYTGKTLGDEYLTLGSPQFADGEYTFHIYGHSRDAVVALTNDSHLNCTFQSAEWEGIYFNRARG